jgi:hypothetical protein
MRNGRDIIRFARLQYRPDLLRYEPGIEGDMFAVDVGEIWVSASSDSAFRWGAHATPKNPDISGYARFGV